MKSMLKSCVAFGLVAIIHSASASASCSIVDQDGSMDVFYCQNSTGKIRCYADVKYDDGSTSTIWAGEEDGHSTGTCYETYSDCWSFGPGSVEPSCS